MKIKRLTSFLLLIVALTTASCATSQEQPVINDEPITPDPVIVSQNETCNHVYDDMTVIKEATCLENGEASFTCTLCGYEEHGVTLALGRHIEDVIPPVPATCEKAGLTTGTRCLICNTTIQSQQVIPRLEHTSSNWITEKEPTCNDDGSKYKICTLCGKTLASEEIKSSGHNIVMDKAVAATCSQSGLTEGKHCSDCGKVIIKQEPIQQLKHSETVIYGKEPTCTEVGLSNGKSCSVCGEITQQQSVIPMTGHSISDWSVIKEPTTTETGLKQKICTTCNQTIETATIAVKSHSYVHTTIQPTCTTQGYTTHVCSECGDSYTDAYIPATNHVASAWMVGQNATCTTKGFQYQKCAFCSTIISTQEIPITSHVASEWTTLQAPTCSIKGTQCKKCLVCNQILSTTELQTTTHQYNNVGKCLICGAIDSASIVSKSDFQAILKWVQAGIEDSSRAGQCLTWYAEHYDKFYLNNFYDYIKYSSNDFTQAYNKSSRYNNTQTLLPPLKSIIDVLDRITKGSYTPVQLADMLLESSEYYESLTSELEKIQVAN